MLRLAVVCLLLSLLLLGHSVAHAQPPRPSFSLGSMTVTLHSSSSDHSVQAQDECFAAVSADFGSRLALPQWDTAAWAARTSFEDKRQGPYLSHYPRIDWSSQVPAGCDPLAWAHRRLLTAVAVIIRMGLNYCHFRAPGYEAPPEVRAVCMPLPQQPAASSTAVGSQLQPDARLHDTSTPRDELAPPCAVAAQSSSRGADRTARRLLGSIDGLRGSAGSPLQHQPNPTNSSSGCVWMETSICSTEGRAVHPWRGLDCQNFVSVLFNMFFGYYATTSLSQAACHPSLAPGRLLHNITTAHLDQLRTGDLLFSRQSRRPSGAPAAVRHVAVFMGATVDFDNASSPFYNQTLLNNIPERHHATFVRCMAHQRRLGRPVWVVADSNFFGPAFRPLCGPYLSSFSHARRIILGAGEHWPLTNHASIASWVADSKTCVSKWALLEQPQHQQHSASGRLSREHVRHGHQHYRAS